MLYKFAKAIFTPLGYLIYRIRVSGREHIPKDGKVIICSNHIHGMDCILLAIFCKRQVFYMGKKELFERPILGPLLRRIGAFPVDRGATDMKAYRHALNILKEDKQLGIFSQGTRAEDFENVKSGVAVFALKSGAPILPVGIKGNYRPFTKMRVQFGEPIPMTQYEGQKVKSELVDEIMEEVVCRVSALSS